MNNLLLNLCIFLDSSRSKKCNEFFNEILSTTKFIVESDLFILIFIIFLIILFKITFIKNFNNQKILNNNSQFLLSFLIFLLFISIIFNFNTNIPWVDDWEWIENLQTKNLTTIEWLFQPANIHNIFVIKTIFLFVNNIFNLNFEFFNYISILLIFFISILFIKNEHIDNKIYLSFFVLLIFSGKQFANFTQASNLAWTICFFFIILFKYLVDNEKPLLILLCTILIFVSPFTFGLGYVLPLYVLTFIYFHKINNIIKFNYIIFSVISIFLSYLIPKIFFNDLELNNINLNVITIIIDPSFYLTFFGVLSNIFLPWINGLAYLGFVIGLIQLILIFLICLKNYNQIGLVSLNNFFRENPFILIGLMFALIVSLTRPDLQTIVAARYSVGSIIFQLGFWLFLFRENRFKWINNNHFIKFLMIYIFLSGLFFPYQGIHWQASRHILNNKILECYKKNLNKKINYCNKLAYKTLFFNGKWYDFSLFEKQIDIMRKNKKSFLNL